MKLTELKCYEGREPRISYSKKFVKDNKLTFERSEKEIKGRIEDMGGAFDFDGEVLSKYLPWESVKETYKDEYVAKVESGEKKYTKIDSIQEAVQDFLDYMVFAWTKAEDERGLSASRSVSKLSAWMWLLGREDLSDILNEEDLYNPYGAPALIKCCEELSIEVPEYFKEFAGAKV